MNCVGLSAGARSRALRFAQRPCASFSQRFGCAGAGDDRQAAAVRICFEIDFRPYFPLLIYHCPSIYWGKRMQNFTLEWNVEWKRVLVRSQDRRSSQRIPSVAALNSSCFICAGRNKNGKQNHLVASSDALLFPQFKWLSVREKQRVCFFFFLPLCV